MSKEITITTLIQALLQQGTSIKNDGTIVWTHCKYCDRSGWVRIGENSGGCLLIHEQGCFIQLASKWLENKTL